MSTRALLAIYENGTKPEPEPKPKKKTKKKS